MTERPEDKDEPGIGPDKNTPLGDTDQHSDVPSDPNAPSPSEYEGSEEHPDE